MTTAITSIEVFETAISIELSSGKKDSSIYISENFIQVICKNAAHKTYRGMGKTFCNFQKALNGYKSKEMINMIHSAKEIWESMNSKVVH